MGLDYKDDVSGPEEYVVSLSVMAAIQSQCIEVCDMFRGMIDSGANISMAPPSLAEGLGLEIHPPLDNRKIGTAEKTGQRLVIEGWIYPDGYTGPIALVKDGFLLLSTSQMQKRGMETTFPKFQLVCLLSDSNGWFATLNQCGLTRLYFTDVRQLIYATRIPYIKQSGDVPMGPATLQGGWAGYVLTTAAVDIVGTSSSTSKRPVPASLIFKVILKEVDYKMLRLLLQRSGLL